MENPKVSFIICTYNSPELLTRAIESILKQEYNEKIEIIIVDGGSNKETLRAIENYTKKYSFVKYFTNKEKLPEGYGKGKWLGWKKCKGDFVMIFDQDNKLQGKNCLKEILKPFEKEDIFGSGCRLFINKNDNLANKYVALIGTDPFFAYRSIDGLLRLKEFGEKKGSYRIIKIDKDNIIITGGNCFIYKKSILDKIGGYIQDTENILRLVNAGCDKFAISEKAETHHLAVRGFVDFIKKKKKWAKTYEVKKNEPKFSYFPENKIQRKQLIINLFNVFTIFPNIFISFKEYYKTKEAAWFLHPILSFATGFCYFFYAFLRKI